MEMLDDKRDTLPEGEYLHMCNALSALFQTTQTGTSQTVSDIEADRRVAAELQNQQGNQPDRIFRAPGVVGPNATPLERAQAARVRHGFSVRHAAVFDSLVSTITRTFEPRELRTLIRRLIPHSRVGQTPPPASTPRPTAPPPAAARIPRRIPTTGENRDRIRTRLRNVISQMETKLAKRNLYPNATMKRKAACLQEQFPGPYSQEQISLQRGTNFSIDGVVYAVEASLRLPPYNKTDDDMKSIYKEYLAKLDRDERETCRRVIADSQEKLRQLEHAS
tara:strand:- start:138 stop:971 length:834 start_codon:yes stop_codon:yes gene_type:complete